MKTKDRHWLAGLLEGEGCFALSPVRAGYRYPVVKLNMTDEDIVARAAALFGSKVHRIAQRNLRHRDTFQTQVSGARAMRIMDRLLPLMGIRRTARILEVMQAMGPAYRAKLARLGRASPRALHS